MYSMRSKCADRLSIAKHNILSIKHFVVAPYSSHNIFYTRDSQTCLQSIPDSEEDQPAVVSSSEFCVSVVLNYLPSRRCSFTESSSAFRGILQGRI